MWPFGLVQASAHQSRPNIPVSSEGPKRPSAHWALTEGFFRVESLGGPTCANAEQCRILVIQNEGVRGRPVPWEDAFLPTHPDIERGRGIFQGSIWPGCF
jgi:hypothetical protein